VWVVGLFGLDVPPEVASAVTTLLAVAAGYIKDPSTRLLPGGNGGLSTVEVLAGLTLIGVIALLVLAT
jgi:uncharacterized membrane protein